MKAYYSVDGDRTLILSLDDVYVFLKDYAPSIARNPEDYDYINARWYVSYRHYTPKEKDVDVTNNKLFIDSVQLNQPDFNRIFIKTLFV